MIRNVTENIKISAIAAAAPSDFKYTDDYISELGDETIMKFKKMTGINGRHAARFEQTSSDLCFAAAKKILEEKHIPLEEIGILVFVTQCPDYNVPATACVLQMRLGLPKDCIAFDVNLGCSGFVNGINIVSSLLHNSNIKYGLLLAGDTSVREKSRHVSLNTNNSFKLLFGDAGTATLLERDDYESNKIISSMRTDGNGFKAIIRPFNEWRNPDMPEKKMMDDIAVFNFTIAEVPTMIKNFMAEEGTSPADYDDLVLHQANLYILKQIAKRTGFAMEKVPVSLDMYGNTSSGSIPLTLVKKYGDADEDRKIRALMCGFGIGLSWGIVSTEICIKNILPVTISDDYFVDGFGVEK